MTVLDPYTGPGTYRKAQLHCHTTASDGRFRPRELLRMYKESGYAFVCLTDHNRVTREAGLDDDTFLAVPGSEDTVSAATIFPLTLLGPHLGRLFVDAPTRRGTAQQRIDATAAAGGLLSLCHPSWTGNLWTGRWPLAAASGLRGVHLVEIWNPHSDSARDLELWTALLRQRGPQAPLWGVAVDDCHHARQFNRGWIMAKVSAVTAAALRDALRRGAFYATTGATAEFGAEEGTVWARGVSPAGARVRFLDARGVLRAEVESPEGRYPVRADEEFIRIEIVGPAGARAWSQPFWVCQGGRP
ncbi:MAG: CehA/McbA family metallohydrolase [Armatimonadota bacterium]|nr:CehA/McbA family metallohydrolase [Armatimonadota bacterium]MDR7452016.1 CehA/McbA family metallohydrolase [Armatimonadota bacterium]MDR7467907.1 CehA/McbA family metallohydrolase [Armatimonadota bacterium]MDR7494240.1 CehA/McbA family metallohydrolase [Armatimonadota bacterium]MDR7500021.1 CehA/McbA family metallohydrolase [Armatimonadota bacterium]